MIRHPENIALVSIPFRLEAAGLGDKRLNIRPIIMRSKDAGTEPP
jgi:hypothetical protein